jgi:hypothetical protein
LAGASRWYEELAGELAALAFALSHYRPAPEDGWQYGHGARNAVG